MMKRFGAVAFGLLLTTAAATAAEELDTDGDGLVTLDEMTAAMPDVTEDGFAVMDANGDGTLDEEEIAAARDAGMLPVMDG